MIRAIAAGLGACLLACGQASAGIVLDQADVPESGSMHAINGEELTLSGLWLGQSFTVGVAGTLARVDIPVFSLGGPAVGGLDFEVLDPSNKAVFSTVIDPTAVSDVINSIILKTDDWSQLVQVDTASADIAVTPGEQMKWLVTEAPGSSNADMLAFLKPVELNYSGGDGLSFTSGSFGHLFPPTDFAFRTYVDVASVPEPSTWMLAILGLGLLGCALRRGRRSEVDALA